MDDFSGLSNLTVVDQSPPSSAYDVFVSHASEDKEGFVRPLTEALEHAGLRVWYDEKELRVGDSLSRRIDEGLASARFGIVVLSPAFLSKKWPEYELRGLVAREIAGNRLILPIWHNVSKEDVLAFSPTLADTKALSTTHASVDEIVSSVLDVVRNEEHSSWLVDLGRRILKNLSKSSFHGYGYDYWPDGGLRSLYDHLRTFTSFQQLVSVFRRPIFVQGPHTSGHLDLNNQFEFGYYNPKFVQWLATNTRYLLRQHQLVAETSENFQKYLSPLAGRLYVTYQILHANPDVNDFLRKHYQGALESGYPRPQLYWGISWAALDPSCPPRVCELMERLEKNGGGEANHFAPLIYFWIRRQIDGTESIFFSLLVDVLKAFDSAGYTNTNTFGRWSLDEMRDQELGGSNA